LRFEVLARGRQEIVGCAVAQELIDVAEERRSALDEFGVNQATLAPAAVSSAAGMSPSAGAAVGGVAEEANGAIDGAACRSGRTAGTGEGRGPAGGADRAPRVRHPLRTSGEASCLLPW
jgi:hypothetical protein